MLTNWIVAAAEQQNFPVQSTSIPGVAQRTGATTYYIEILPQAARDGAKPVLALAPGVGDVDVMMASELMEAGRAVASGFVTADRTLAIASTSRFFVMGEKIAMGDGRYDPAKLKQAIADNSNAHILIDMEAIARKHGVFINSVMLGIIAGSGRLPIPVDAFEAAIRADGKGVDGNLRGFRAGLEAAQSPEAAVASAPKAAAPSPAADFESDIARFPKRRATSSAKASAGSPTIRTKPMRGSISTGSRLSATPMPAPRQKAA